MKTTFSAWLHAATVACVLLPVACAPKAIVVPEANKLPAPPARESARPALADALQNATKATAEAQRARDSVDRAKAAAGSAQISLQASLAEVRRLLAQRSATSEELQTLYTKLEALEKELVTILADLTQAKDSLATEKLLSANTLAKLRTAEALTIEKDAEVAELRRILKYSETLTAQATAKAQQAVTASEKLRSQVGVEQGRAKTWRNIAIGIGAALLLAIGAHILRSYMRI
jgi:chromosome segregation ATPase